MGLYSFVLTGKPHKWANAPFTRISADNTDLIDIISSLVELGGLDFKKLVCEVYDGDTSVDTIEETEIPYSGKPSQFRFGNSYRPYLQSGTKHKFKIFIVTQSGQANMNGELNGNSSEVEATYFDKFPDMSDLSLVTGDEQMSVSWQALTGFEMPVQNLKCDILMDGVIIASDLETTTILKTGLNNGDEHEFIVKAKFNLSEDPIKRDFIVESEPALLGPFKNPDAPTQVVVSNLSDTSLKLSWTASNFNGCEFHKYRVFDNNQLIKENKSNSTDLVGLTKGKDYNLSVVTVATRSEMADNINLQNVESAKSQSVSTRI